MSEVTKEVKNAFDSLEWVRTEDGERLIVLTIKNRKIPLCFTLSDVKAMTEEVGKVTEIQEALSADFLSPEHVSKVISMIRIMGNSGLIAMGEKPDLTNEWIGRRLKMKDITTELMTQLLGAFYGAMEMETEEAETEGKTIDVTLREIQKKKEADS